MKATLTRDERLRSKRTLERLFGQGSSGFVYPFRYFCIVDAAADTAAATAGTAVADYSTATADSATTSVATAVQTSEEGVSASADVSASVGESAVAGAEYPARVLFSVPKRYHKRANKRNLLRRRTREAYRLNKWMLTEGGVAGADIALVYSVKDVADYKRIENAVKRIMSQIVASR